MLQYVTPETLTRKAKVRNSGTQGSPLTWARLADISGDNLMLSILNYYRTNSKDIVYYSTYLAIFAKVDIENFKIVSS